MRWLLTSRARASARAVFAEAGSAAELLRRLEAEIREVDRLLESCAWRTRESAEAVSDVLHAAEFALHPTRSSQTALQLTLRVLSRAFDSSHPTAMDARALAVNRRLAQREGFAQRMQSRAAKWMGSRPASSAGFSVC